MARRQRNYNKLVACTKGGGNERAVVACEEEMKVQQLRFREEGGESDVASFVAVAIACNLCRFTVCG